MYNSLADHVVAMVLSFTEDKIISIGRDPDRPNKVLLQYEGDDRDNRSIVTKPFVKEVLKGNPNMVGGPLMSVNKKYIKDIETKEDVLGSKFYAVTKDNEKIAIPQETYNKLAPEFKKEKVEGKPEKARPIFEKT